MSAISRFVTLITVFTFIVILCVSCTPIENIKANAHTSRENVGICPTDLTGKWNGNDRGTYWIRQRDSAIMWFGTTGLEEGTAFSNVFHGVRNGDTITGEWADVPMGTIMQQGEITFNCTQEGGIDILKRTSETGGFGGSEFSKFNHRMFTLAPMQSGSCHMNVPSLVLFPDGHAVWRAHVWSDDEDDAWVIGNLVLFDKSGNVLHVFPKFSSRTLQTDIDFLLNDPHTEINWAKALSFPAEILDSVGSVLPNQASC